MEDVLVLKRDVEMVLTELGSIVIHDAEGHERAGEFLRKIKQTAKIVQDHFEPDRKAAYELYQNVLTETKRYIDLLKDAETKVKRMMSVYATEQERIRREEEERRRLEEAERRRMAEDIRLAQAEKYQDESLLDIPIVLMPLPDTKPIPEVTKPAGISYVEMWTFEIVDIAQIPREYMMPDERKIRQLVVAQKDKAQAILGAAVRVYSEKSVRARA